MLTERELLGDVVVIGGGMAGVCAALAAARHGARTILVQDRPVLGGNSSSEIRVHVSGADAGHPGFREGGILEELRLEEVVRNPQRNPCEWDLILWEKVTAEPLLTLLLNTTAARVEMEEGRVTAVRAIRLTTEDEFVLRGEVFIDCTGNGTVGFLAGGDFAWGREGPEEYGEEHAQGPDRLTMGDSIMWFAQDMGRPMPFTPPPWARVFPTDEDLPHRSHQELGWGFWWIEYGGERDTIKDAEEIRDELLACMLGVWDHVKNRGGHGAENWALTWWNFLPGKRESRRLLGPHILTENDIVENRQHEDCVCHGGWALDAHPPGGIFSPEKPCTWFPTPIYGIPLRSLYSRNVPNLFMAGRDGSFTHMGLASTRVMGTCAVMGQAVGTAAALCTRDGCLPGELSPAQIHELQQILLRDDQYLPGVRAEDPVDLAQRAKITVSTEAESCPASAVTDGWSRALDGVPHQWRSREGSFPQWLELAWESSVALSEVHLTFDSGFERPLCLSHSDYVTQQMIRAAQPETVRDYDLLGQVEGEWQTLLEERGNYQRKRIHSLAGRFSALRLVVHATQGDAAARVFEVRVY